MYRAFSPTRRTKWSAFPSKWATAASVLPNLQCANLCPLLPGTAHKFGKNGPSDKWFRQFLGRHPEISFRTPEKLSTLRKANSTKEVIGPYFDKLKELVEKHKYPPENIWNADETSVCPRMKEEKILAPKGNFTIFSPPTLTLFLTNPFLPHRSSSCDNSFRWWIRHSNLVVLCLCSRGENAAILLIPGEVCRGRTPARSSPGFTYRGFREWVDGFGPLLRLVDAFRRAHWQNEERCSGTTCCGWSQIQNTTCGCRVRKATSTSLSSRHIRRTFSNHWMLRASNLSRTATDRKSSCIIPPGKDISTS